MIVPINRAVLGQHRFARFDVDQVDGRLAGCDSLFGDQFVHLLVIQLGLPSTPFEFQAAVRISLHIAPGAGLEERYRSHTGRGRGSLARLARTRTNGIPPAK